MPWSFKNTWTLFLRLFLRPKREISISNAEKWSSGKISPTFEISFEEFKFLLPNNRSKLRAFTVDSKTICWKSAKNSIFDYVINYVMTKSSKSKKFIRKCSIFRILFLNLALALKINRFHARLLNCPTSVIKTLMVKKRLSYSMRDVTRWSNPSKIF